MYHFFQLDVVTVLPNESLLAVLQFLDYKSVVFAKLTEKHFQRFITKFADDLAHRRRFRVSLETTRISFNDLTVGPRWSIQYESDKQASLAAACRELDRVIGPHAVVSLNFSEDTWKMRGVGVIFKAAPPLKYAEDVAFYSPHGSAIGGNSEALMSNLAGMKSLYIQAHCDIIQQFNWSFLRQECARKPRLIKVFAKPPVPNEYVQRSIEKLVRCCATLRDGEPLKLDFSRDYFTGAFGHRIIEVSVRNS